MAILFKMITTIQQTLFPALEKELAAPLGHILPQQRETLARMGKSLDPVAVIGLRRRGTLGHADL